MPLKFVIVTKLKNLKSLFYNLYVDMSTDSFVMLIIDGAGFGMFCKWIWPTEIPRLLTLFTFSTLYDRNEDIGMNSSITYNVLFR